jgi:hypothetical protein
MRSAAQEFTVAHDLYVAFRNPEVLVSFHSGRNSATYKKPIEGFWFYEVYTLNGSLVYNQVQNLASAVVNCGNCVSQTSRRLNLGGLLLRIQGVVSPFLISCLQFICESNSVEVRRRGTMVNTHGIHPVVYTHDKPPVVNTYGKHPPNSPISHIVNTHGKHPW